MSEQVKSNAPWILGIVGISLTIFHYVCAVMCSAALVCLRTKFNYKAIVYLFGISVIRFVCEFFRGDQRGDFLGILILSPQQIMSIGFFFVAMGMFCFKFKRPISCVKETHGSV